MRTLFNWTQKGQRTSCNQYTHIDEKFRYTNVLQESVFILSYAANLQSCRYLCIGPADVSQPSRRLARPAHGTRLVMGELARDMPS